MERESLWSRLRKYESSLLLDLFAAHLLHRTDRRISVADRWDTRRDSLRCVRRLSRICLQIQHARRNLRFIVITTPVFILFLIRIWPYTPVGRRMLNIRPGETADLPRKTTSKGTPLDDLIGQHGVAKNNLLPSGMILVNGENIDAVSTGMPIDSGTPIIITKVDTGHLYVRALTSAELTSQNPSAPTSPPLLEDSLESFDFD
jgi:hypothetical protein